jgi:hypothetical protein
MGSIANLYNNYKKIPENTVFLGVFKLPLMTKF